MKFSSVLSLLFLVNSEFYGVLFLVLFMKNMLFSEEEYSFMFKFSDMNFWMSLLVIVLFLMILSVELQYKLSLNLLLIFLFVLMMISSLIIFFLLYEMIFILIMFAIILLGYSFERLMAGFLMMFYSFVFSSPMLMMILLFDYVFLIQEWLSYSIIMTWFLVGSFMVKFPIFGVHYWLPVAHVEASTIGSMILAGLLLKLGSVGLIYVVMYMKFMMKFHWLILSVLLVMMMIISLSDLKMMIAYSSVAHMTMVFYIIMMGSFVAKKGVILMMFYHGFISPLMFWLVGMLAWWKTRSLMVIKFISFSYLFILCLFFLFILNMSFPPFMGFLSEILMLKSLFINKISLYIMIFSILCSCYYNIYLFWCFNGMLNMIFKLNFYSIDLFMFLMLSLILNF